MINAERNIFTRGETERVLVINDDSGAMRSRLASARINHISLWLEPVVANWQQIIDFLDAGSVNAVMLNFPESSMGVLGQPEFTERHEEFFTRLETHRHLVLFQSAKLGLSPMEDAELSNGGGTEYAIKGGRHPSEESRHAMILRICKEHQLNVLPYMNNLELSALASEFIDCRHSNLIFRMYVPSDEERADQVPDIVALFRSFLSATLNIGIRQSTRFTECGILYELYGEGSLYEHDVTSRVSAFSEIIEVCIAKPSETEKILSRHGAGDKAAAQLSIEFSKMCSSIISYTCLESTCNVVEIKNGLRNEFSEMKSDQELRSVLDDVFSAVRTEKGFEDIWGGWCTDMQAMIKYGVACASSLRRLH